MYWISINHRSRDIFLCKHLNVAVVLDRFNCVSLEQFIVDMDIIRRVEYFKHFFTQDPAEQLEEICFPEIRKAGQGGNFLSAMSTVQNCRKTPFISQISCHETTQRWH